MAGHGIMAASTGKGTRALKRSLSALPLAGACALGCNAVFGVDALDYDRPPDVVAPVPECANGVLDGHESDVDCGGGCAPCGPGARCLGPDDCVSGLCLGSVCAECQWAAACPLGKICDVGAGHCVDRLATGRPCTEGTQCLSGFCPAHDGVCCDTSCSLTCEACLAAKTGSPDGVCDFVNPALAPDPDGECPLSEPATCSSTGSCDGTLTRCVLWAAETLCASVQCNNSLAKAASYCDGAGHCVAGATTSCGAYACNGTGCFSSCTLQTHCNSQHYCNGGACIPKLGAGAACGVGYQCLSGN